MEQFAALRPRAAERAQDRIGHEWSLAHRCCHAHRLITHRDARWPPGWGDALVL